MIETDGRPTIASKRVDPLIERAIAAGGHLADDVAVAVLEQKRRMKIGIDIDGCVYHWTRGANEALMTRYGIDDPGEHQGWDFLQGQVTREQWQWLWGSEAAELVFGRLDLIYAGAADAINELAKDHVVHFVTHRNPYRTTEATGRFLNYWFRNYRGVTVLDNSIPKWEVGSWDVFIDDKPETVAGMLENTEAAVFMPIRDWNRHVIDEITNPQFEVFAEWSELVAAVNLMEVPA